MSHLCVVLHFLILLNSNGMNGGQTETFKISLNSAFFCQIDSISSICLNQSCIAVHGTGRLFEAQVVQKAQWPIWQSIRLINLGSGFYSHHSFDQWSNFLVNLLNLLSRNLGKTPFSCEQLSEFMCGDGNQDISLRR